MFHHDLPGGFVPARPGGRLGGRVAVIVVVVTALICGAVAAGILWSAGADANRELAAHRHRVRATTTARAEDPSVIAPRGAQPSVAPAVWEYPRDVRRSGSIHVPLRTPEGRTVTIWVDDAGTPARRPGGAVDLALTSVVEGSAVAGAVGTLGAGALVLVRRRADGRRLAAWESEWERVEPVWSGRLRRGGPGADGD